MPSPLKLPSISIVIPTLNSGAVLDNCLSSINSQIYPREKIKILICDGGSTDNTLKIAQKYSCQIYSNPLKTAESGKAIGVKNSNSEFIALIDSDNILPSQNWLKNMIAPLLQETQAIGSEPWEYTYRPHAGFIERYASLTGINDPYSLFVGNYDRVGALHAWTGLKLSQEDKGNYLKVVLANNQPVPTIGANGTIFRSNFLKNSLKGDYFFDVDILNLALKKLPELCFIKTKVDIIHTYCESSFSKFIRKQIRRVKDLYSFRPDREFSTKSFDIKNILFVIYSLTFFPALVYSLRGFIKKRDIAWFFHPFACFVTAIIYSFFTILKIFHLLKPQSRQTWSQ
ncbi:glycosyltransferase family 2 protein [Candidatus Shapirobacteria bacterium]|nr:glycosyltransferase family 2 protein [Candidatus Shapirobacteria bacterium]